MKKFLIALIDFYRHQISPYKGGACCRFVPTCSQYAREAIEKYGALYGTYLAVRRILRCYDFAIEELEDWGTINIKAAERKNKTYV